MSEFDKGKWAKTIAAADELEGKWEESQTKNFHELMCCADCGHLAGLVTQYGNKYARCQEFGLVLTSNDPVMNCTCYYKRNSMSIHDMKDMATMVEIKRGVGFIQEEAHDDRDDEENEDD